jgi:hypothetical protein
MPASSSRPASGGTNDPAPGTHAGKEAQRFGIENVERRAGDERDLPFSEQAHRAHFVGLDGEAAVGDGAAQGLEVRFRFDQRQRGQDDFLAGGGQLCRNIEVVVESQLVATRTDRLAEVDDVHRRGRDGGVEVERGLPRPVVLERAKRYLHHFQGRL